MSSKAKKFRPRFAALPKRHAQRAEKTKRGLCCPHSYPAALEPGTPRMVKTARIRHPVDHRPRRSAGQRLEKLAARRPRNVAGPGNRERETEYRAFGLGMVCPLGSLQGEKGGKLCLDECVRNQMARKAKSQLRAERQKWTNEIHAFFNANWRGAQLDVSWKFKARAIMLALGKDHHLTTGNLRYRTWQEIGVWRRRNGAGASLACLVDPRAFGGPSREQKAEFYASWAWRTLRMKILKRYGAVCMCCGAQPGDTGASGLPVRIVVDHIKPLSVHWHLRLDKNNLQVLCDECNQGKGAWDETDHRPAGAGDIAC